MKNGFTMVELMVVMGIISILSTIALFNFMSFRNHKIFQCPENWMFVKIDNVPGRVDPKFRRDLRQIQRAKRRGISQDLWVQIIFCTEGKSGTKQKIKMLLTSKNEIRFK